MDYKNKFDLGNKTSIVTGAGAGIGKEIAIALAQFGSNIVVADINADHAKQTVKELQSFNITSLAIPIDVSKEEEVIRLVNNTMEQFGKIDILINNAGKMQKSRFEEMSIKDWKNILEVNLDSVFLMSKYVGIQMIKSGGGTIVNTASISSFIANKEPQCAYNVSKAGIHMLTQCLASEWAKYNIRVNSIAPGYTKTTMTKGLFENAENVKDIESLIPLGRVAEPSEIASLAVFLASDASSYTTGSVIHADGGYLVW
ncbi:SDR family NAD(P)-dependent oxidoreductase [Neobacillus kokaensis]|uniref:2-deoxy-D-gluconate 3-dehydrogenase n=1 Tax=Neobacillus kokaensis TaxID=2759023 RepID=A0ABQ3N1N0_9BACI|nr:SDR family oxidoreductase [Neobacillus kokaensis]GHH98840.1 2-deoxy-D-gluconate 3-dehydrogenase [Neobacillus kokaensis]